MLGSQGANKAEVKSQLFIHEVSDKQLTDNRDNYKKNRKNDGGTENQIFHSPFGMICLAAESPAQSGESLLSVASLFEHIHSLLMS